jgi:hypothetical protein
MIDNLVTFLSVLAFAYLIVKLVRVEGQSKVKSVQMDTKYSRQKK